MTVRTELFTNLMVYDEVKIPIAYKGIEDIGLGHMISCVKESTLGTYETVSLSVVLHTCFLYRGGALPMLYMVVEHIEAYDVNEEFDSVMKRSLLLTFDLNEAIKQKGAWNNVYQMTGYNVSKEELRAIPNGRIQVTVYESLRYLEGSESDVVNHLLSASENVVTRYSIFIK